jgi:Protein of unknown function (DUF1573)
MFARLSIVVLFVLFGLGACDNKQKAESETNQNTKNKSTSKGPVMDFQGKNVVDLGTLKEGEVKKHTYEFVNTGTEPLQISYANASCGCTVPSWPKNAIPVGGKGAITVEFNSKNKEGKLYKTVSIYANTKPEFTSVAFNVEVLKD